MHNSGSQQEMVKLTFLVTVKPSVKNVCLIFLMTLLICVMTGKVLGCPLVTCKECARNMHRALCERTKNLNDVNDVNKKKKTFKSMFYLQNKEKMANKNCTKPIKIRNKVINIYTQT